MAYEEEKQRESTSLRQNRTSSRKHYVQRSGRVRASVKIELAIRNRRALKERDKNEYTWRSSPNVASLSSLRKWTNIVVKL